MRLTTRLAAALILFVLAAPAADARSDPAADAYKAGDYATAYRLYLPRADAGDADAQMAVAEMYNLGQGVTQNYEQSVTYLRKAADQGHARAQFALSVMFYRGHGVPKDEKAAEMWARKAAEQGNGAGQYFLGTLYLEGTVVPKSIPDAFVWYTLSTRGDNPRMVAAARKISDGLRPKMSPSEVAEAEKRIAAFKPVKQTP
jgi:TPR repeat protein